MIPSQMRNKTAPSHAGKAPLSTCIIQRRRHTHRVRLVYVAHTRSFHACNMSRRRRSSSRLGTSSRCSQDGERHGVHAVRGRAGVGSMQGQSEGRRDGYGAHWGGAAEHLRRKLWLEASEPLHQRARCVNVVSLSTRPLPHVASDQERGGATRACPGGEREEAVAQGLHRTRRGARRRRRGLCCPLRSRIAQI
jgi:hypothetical protein